MPTLSHPLESSFSRLEKFRLYETATFFYLVGFDNLETMFRLLKINRLIQKPKSLAEIVREDDLVYSASDIAEILKMIDDGNKTSGGLVKICSAVGLVGFVKFVDCYYFTLITQRKEVGCIAGNFIYSIKATEMFPVRPRDEPESNAFRSLWKKLNKKLSQSSAEIAESRYMGLFQFIDMTKDFFFSYTYDLTHSLQHNYMHAATSKNRKRNNVNEADDLPPTTPQEIFQWNYYQVHDLQDILGPTGTAHWIMPLIYGSYQQKRFSIFGKCVDVIMIARRSRHYAGTRYLKRGINVHGKAANDCEVEQVIQHEDSYRSNFCSYLQMRASIPTYWYQETSVTMPKPPILINRVDPDFRATEEHFADMFRRYSSPIIALDLVKQHEKRARESMVGSSFRQAVEVVNESIPREHKVRYIALDYSRITSIAKGKNKGKGVDGTGTAAGNVVGQEWKNLVESSLTADDKASKPSNPQAAQAKTQAQGQGQGQDNAARRESPVLGLPTSGGTGSGKGPGEHHDEAAAPRHNQDIKIDVLRELEDIATMTIGETGFFCNSPDFLSNVKLLPVAKLEKVNKMGHLEQRGVLRTNCIDCLDRTNGAQFAVAMKFLNVSLQALGICSSQQGLEPSSQMLVSLMEMYGEMGDKIALQYGGSEAHRKVPGGQIASSAKQSELLTSIKRYYSNAFTDMVKQDAMNVFLGCFQPTESDTPLWDLETDYNLHNHTLCPPPANVNKVIFGNIYLDSHALAVPAVRQLIESSVKKTLTDGGEDSASLVPVHSKKKLKKILQSEDLTIKTDKIDDVVRYLKGLDIPSIDRVHLLKNYFVRNMSALQRELDEATQDSAAQSGEGKDAEGRPAAQLPAKMQLKIAVRNIGRLEKRKFLRSVASKKISSVAASWWKTALLEFEDSLYGASECAAAAGLAPQQMQKPQSYFHRVYPPYELSEFDTLLSLDFFAPVDAAHDITDVAPKKAMLAPDGTVPAAPRPNVSAISAAASAAALSKRFDREYLSGSARAHDSYALAHMNDECPIVSQASTPVPLSGNAANNASPSKQGAYFTPADAQDAGAATGGFQISRYVRKLVGGFLRKEDTAAAPTSTGKPSQKNRGGKLEWNWYHHLVSFHEHRVSKKTSQLYTRYVSVAQNNLLLMEKMGNQRLAEEEYFLLLRDYSIDVDNVSGMEHLSIEGYVSSEVNQGVFQGMPQRESAIAAYSFLTTSLVQVEAELQRSAVLEARAKEPFAPAPTVGAAHTRNGSGSSPLKRGQTIMGVAGNGNNSNSGKYDAVHEAKNLVRTTLQRNPALEAHIERCVARVNNVRGLEREFRKHVADYITQQAAYSKEISHDHLATRLSATTAEHTIVEYAMQFDHLSLAHDVDAVDFLANCSPAYENFEEWHNLKQTLAPVSAKLKEQKKVVVNEVQASQASHSSVSEQLGLGASIATLQQDLQTDYSLELYNRPYPYVADIALSGLNTKQSHEFFQMDADLYVRSTNPFMQLNEVAVNSFSRSLAAY